LPILTVIVEWPPPGAGIGFGLKLAVVPEGNPVTDSAMELLKPPLTLVETLAFP
jgi:hypothetical protein